MGVITPRAATTSNYGSRPQPIPTSHPHGRKIAGGRQPASLGWRAMTTRILVPLAVAVASLVALAALTTGVGSQDGSQAAVRELHDLFDADWERVMRENPTWASS